MLKVVTIVGTRPEIIRLSRIIPKLDECFNHILIHTGQNYDFSLNEIFFQDLEIREPDVFLNISEVWGKKRAALEMVEGQHHLWQYYENVAENRGNHFRRNSGGQASGIDARFAEAFQSVYPRTVFSL